MQLWWFIALGARFWLSYLIFRMVSSLVLSEYPSLWEELAKYFDPCLSFLTSGSHYTNARKDFNIWKNEDLLHSVPSTGCGLHRCRGGVCGALCLWLISQHACLPQYAHQLAGTVPQRFVVELGCEVVLCCLQILQHHARILSSSLLSEHDIN